VSEAVALTSKDIDSGRMVIHVRSGKGRKDRYVMLSEQLLGILRAYCKCAGPQHFLFPGTDPARPITVRSLQRACRVAADIARAEDAGHRDRVATTSIPRGAKKIDKSTPALDSSCSRYSAISLQSAEVVAPKSN
jgi:integrase